MELPIKISLEEESKLNELRSELADDILALKEKGEGHLDLIGDVRLLRFLQGHVTVKKAAMMYRKHLEWREEEGIEGIRREIVQAGLGEETLDNSRLKALQLWPAYNAVMQYLPMNLRLEGLARCGGPVDIQMCGRWDVGGFVKAISRGDFSPKDFLFLFIRHMEMTSISLDKLSRSRGELVKVVAIRHCEGVSLRDHMSPRFFALMKPWISAAQNNYPESLEAILFMHVPWWFNKLWGLVSPMFDPNSLKRIRMFPSSGWEGELHGLVDPALLPPGLGGSSGTTWCSDTRFFPTLHVPGQGLAKAPLAMPLSAGEIERAMQEKSADDSSGDEYHECAEQ